MKVHDGRPSKGWSSADEIISLKRYEIARSMGGFGGRGKMRRKLERSFRWLWASALVGMALPAMASDSFVGEVVGVADGDTVTVLMDNKIQHKIRLAEIDTPERLSPMGRPRSKR